MVDATESSAARARKDYSARLRASDEFQAALYRQMVDWLAVPPGSSVLDAGCGAGGFTLLLAAAVGQKGKVAALDLAPAHLAATEALLAATRYAPVVSYHAGATEALPFPDGAFDLAWCSHVLHGLDDRLAGLRELRRVLKLGGRVAVREDYWLKQLLPPDLGLGDPGLEYRLAAHEAQELIAWQHSVPEAVHYPFGWTRLLRDAGFHDVTARSFLHELLPPFSAAQIACLLAHYRAWLDDAASRALLSSADARTLAALTDPHDPHYIFARDDLYFVSVATVYTGVT